jgi:hypothetical protein
MKLLRVIFSVLILAATALGVARSVNAQSSDSIYVTETGHWIWGDFLHLYNSSSDPLLLFGYPITDDFTDPLSDTRVQYFQKVRFDMVDTSQGQKVQIAPLAKLMYRPGAPIADIVQEGPTCRSFSSGFAVCYAFLQFYDANNGTAFFGDPISSVEVIDGRYMQYFENVRMEWWPDRPSGQRVILTDLGRLYFDKFVGNPDLLKAEPPANSAGNLIEPIARTFVLRSLIGAGESQTIYVIAQDQYLRPLDGAQVGVTLSFPDGTSEFYRLNETNEFGISQFTFNVTSLPVRSLVNVKAEVTLRGETAAGTSWFRLWW